ncbi:twin-arginine translocation signal domain-containing protein [Microvirga sp. GCM10011540]|uniref:twin-arginine translocation signal domain-containing protein n=1 Tax=Microvirga sp. GCM10011540 TaxID=3317338 RepID=UPI00360C6169
MINRRTLLTHAAAAAALAPALSQASPADPRELAARMPDLKLKGNEQIASCSIPASRRSISLGPTTSSAVFPAQRSTW